MRNKFFFLILPAALLMQSCSNEFDLTATWKDIPIIYGALSLADTAHYIRVEKAFVDPEKNAFETAQIADSLYYENASVELVRLSDNKVFTLRRVDGNVEGFDRDTGIFAHSPNYLYKIRANELQLKGGDLIQLRLNRGENKEIVTAQTRILPNMGYLEGKPPSQINAWNVDIPIRVAWRTNSADAVIFDVQVEFKYSELPSSGQVSFKSQTWKPFTNYQVQESTSFIQVELESDQFFAFLGNSIEADPTIRRAFRGVDIKVYGGGKEIAEFVNITFANSGITGSQDPPVYTNISEGLGIFTSKSEAVVKDIQFGPGARDSLVRGRFTKDLNFL